nr:DNA helicase [Tanacetum cinerariifolium]
MPCSFEFGYNQAFAANEDTTADVWKRKNTHSPLIAREEEALSSRTMTRRVIWIWVIVINNVATVDVCFAFIQQLFKNNQFMKHIQAYNQMFSMTSFGAKINHSVNKGRGPYVFKISGQIYHWIGSLFPKEGHHLRFLQLYVYDTRDKLSNIMHYFGGLDEISLNPEIVEGLIHVLDEHNGLVRQFSIIRDRCNADDISSFKIRLNNMGGVCGYELPTADILGAMVFENGPRSRTNFDSRLDFIRRNQNDLRADFLLGLYDVVSRGDNEGIAVGSKIMLLNTFTGGPGYMYNHYLDALEICKSLGNPQIFITFMCNVKWPEIKCYMTQYPELTPSNIADIICKVFEQKVKDFIRFLKEIKIFGYVSAEFQKRRLPHCHTLLWVDSKNTLKDAPPIDEYISVEIPDPVQDPKGYKLVTKLMMHEPCGAANLGPDRILEKISNSEASTSTVGTTKQIDEIENYVDGHFICPYEACLRIFDFPIHCREPVLQILNVHLEVMQRINFCERIGDLFYFRMLLCHQKGCKSPDEVRTVNNQMLPTFRTTCEAL